MRIFDRNGFNRLAWMTTIAQAQWLPLYHRHVAENLVLWMDNKTGECYASARTIGDQLGLARQYVTVILLDLERCGLITIERRQGHSHRIFPNPPERWRPVTQGDIPPVTHRDTHLSPSATPQEETPVTHGDTPEERPVTLSDNPVTHGDNTCHPQRHRTPSLGTPSLSPQDSPSRGMLRISEGFTPDEDTGPLGLIWEEAIEEARPLVSKRPRRRRSVPEDPADWPSDPDGWMELLLAPRANQPEVLVAMISKHYPRQVERWRVEGVSPFSAVGRLVARGKSPPCENWPQALKAVWLAIGERPKGDLIDWVVGKAKRQRLDGRGQDAWRGPMNEV